MSQSTFYIISGTSGSGKTIALQELEDLGFYCIDNLPASLVAELATRMTDPSGTPQRCAVSIDSRNHDFLGDLSSNLASLKQLNIDARIIFTDADDATLLKRYSETRRKHPLTDASTSLSEAIAKERTLLEKVADIAHQHINTSRLTPHELRQIIRDDCGTTEAHACTLLFQSFGFKYGGSVEADFVFDVRCLPNPHWDAELKSLNGTDQAVIDFLAQQDDCIAMINDIAKLLNTWIPKFIAQNRNYITVGIGCTGGQHRSVFVCEQLKQHFAQQDALNTLVRHRELTLPSS